MSSSKLKSFLILFSRLLRCWVSQFVLCLMCFYLADLQLLFSQKIYDVWFYPSCLLPNIDEKHFLKLLSSLNSIFTVSIHCLVFTFTRNCFVLTDLIFFPALALSAYDTNLVHLINFKICWLSFSIFPFVLQYFLYLIVFGSSRIHSEIFPFPASLLIFFSWDLKKQPTSNTISVCIGITWWYVFFFTHVDMCMIW